MLQKLLDLGLDALEKMEYDPDNQLQREVGPNKTYSQHLHMPSNIRLATTVNFW